MWFFALVQASLACVARGGVAWLLPVDQARLACLFDVLVGPLGLVFLLPLVLVSGVASRSSSEESFCLLDRTAAADVVLGGGSVFVRNVACVCEVLLRRGSSCSLIDL